MIKRMAKVTSLLVCAASIVSVIPAYAADVKKIDTIDGTLYNVKAKGAGIYIDGEINGKEEAQYFLTPDGKYNELSGVDDGMAVDDLLLNQYLVMDDNDTVLDIKNNYKVVDDKTRDDLQSDVADTIRKKLRDDNDGRFADSEETAVKTATKFLAGGSGLSSYAYTLKTDKQLSVASKTTDTVYVDYAGNYVDADYNLGNIKVITTGGSINFKNTEDTYEVKDGNTTYEYRAIIKDKGYVTDISDSVYRWADLSIYKKVKDTDDSTYVNVTDKIGFGSNGYKSFVSSGDTSVRVLQKFSKTAASDKIDGIKYSKDAATYFLADEDGKDETKSTSDKVILGKDKTQSALKVGATPDTTDSVKITGNDKGFCSIYYSVNEKKVYAQTLQLKSKEGFNYVDLGDTDNSESDTAGISNSGGLAYVLNGGYVKIWDGDESFTKLYKVDGAMDHMSIGSKDFIILWNEDDDIYSIVNNKKDAAATTGDKTATTTGAAVTATSAGWVKNANGTWSYNKADGTKTIGWFKDGSSWYYLKTDGTMATGWVQDGSTWYYLNASGAMQTGWVNDNGTWYYCDSTGAMLSNTTVEGYVLGANGAWVK